MNEREKNEKEEENKNIVENPINIGSNTGEVNIGIPGTNLTIDPSDGSIGIKIPGTGMSIDLDGK